MKSLYKVTLGSGFEHWERFKLFLTVVGYDSEGGVACYHSSTAKEEDGTISVATEPCACIEIYACVIAGEFPETDKICEAPPFPAQLSVYRDGSLIENSRREVNQWGGMTISGYRLPNR